MSERCEMCGDAIADGGTGRLHDTYDCAESLLTQRSILVSRVAKLEAVAEAAKGTVEAAKEMRNHTTGSEIAFITRDWFDNEVRVYDRAKAELERVK